MYCGIDINVTTNLGIYGLVEYHLRKLPFFFSIIPSQIKFYNILIPAIINPFLKSLPMPIQNNSREAQKRAVIQLSAYLIKPRPPLSSGITL